MRQGATVRPEASGLVWFAEVGSSAIRLMRVEAYSIYFGRIKLVSKKLLHFELIGLPKVLVAKLGKT